MLVARPAKWFINGFHSFLRRYLRRHFHSIGIERASLLAADVDAETPLIVYANHPSWWDPLVAQFLNRTLLEGRDFFAPIDAEALEQYRVFEKLGFFGVKLSSPSGAAAFLKTSRSILAHQQTSLWLTPEGRFADVRDQDAELMPGLAHLCWRSDRAVAVPLALEYTFWDERLPVCLVSLGRPIRCTDHPDWSKQQWAEAISSELRLAQNRLSGLAVRRDSEPFENLLRGQRGSGWFYDSFRKMKSLLSGQRFKASHGDQFQ